jgi:hypothetical protein
VTQPITLDLPERTLQRAHETAQRTGRSLEMVLAEWVERGSAQEDAMTLLLNGPHHLYTPLGGEATAQALLAYLKAQQRDAGQ